MLSATKSCNSTTVENTTSVSQAVGSKTRKEMHWREISTDSTASASTQCTQNGVLISEFDALGEKRINWGDLSSDEEDDRLGFKPSVTNVTNDRFVERTDANGDTRAQEETRHDNEHGDVGHYDNSRDPAWYNADEQANAPPRLCLAELLDMSRRMQYDAEEHYDMRLDESHLRSLSAYIDESSTPTYSDSDHEYYSFGVLWVEKDAFKSQDEAHPLSQPLADLCHRQRASLKRFRSAPNLLRWLTKPRRNTSRRQKRSYVCVCAQESKSAIEAFLQTWEDFIVVQNEKNMGKPIIYTNQRTEDMGMRSWSWSQKQHFPTFADACTHGSFPPSENVVWVKEGESEFQPICEALQAAEVKNLLEFDTVLDCIQYFTSQVEQYGCKWRRKKDKDKKERDGPSLRVWPANEPKYTVLCKGAAVALESFFRSWKSNAADGPADRLITYGEIPENEEKCEIHRIYQTESLNTLIEEAETSLSALADSKSVNYSQYSSEWGSQCDRDWAPSEASFSTHDRESDPGKRSSGGEAEHVSCPPVFVPRWHASGSRLDRPPKIGCRLVLWRPQGLAPPKGIPSPAWKHAKRVPDDGPFVPHFFPDRLSPMVLPRTISSAPPYEGFRSGMTRAEDFRCNDVPIGRRTSAAIRANSGSPPPVFAPKSRLKETKPKPLRSRPLQSPVRVLAGKSLGKSSPHVNPRRLCTTPLQAPAFPFLAPIQEEQ